MQLLRNCQVSTSCQKPRGFINVLVRRFWAAREPVIFCEIDVHRGERASDAFFQVGKAIRDEASPEDLNILVNIQSRKCCNGFPIRSYNQEIRSERKKDSRKLFKISRIFCIIFLMTYIIHYILFNINYLHLHFGMIIAEIILKL